MRLRVYITAILLAATANACSNNKQYFWNDQMHIWFDNGAVPNKTPRTQWTGAQEEVLLRRVGYADVAAIGQVTHVGTYQRFDDELQVVLSFRAADIMHGEVEAYLDKQGELRLALDGKAKDFRLALLNRKHLPGTRFLILLKKLPDRPSSGDEEGGWRASLRLPKSAGVPPFRWALYHADATLVSEVRKLYELQRTRDEDRDQDTGDDGDDDDDDDDDDEPAAEEKKPAAAPPAKKPVTAPKAK